MSVANTTTGLPLRYTFILPLQRKQTKQLAPQSPVAAGPRANPETRPVAELAHAMWFDSQEDTLEFLLKAGLEPQQSSTGIWQLVLHRSLRVDSQAASFRQRSGRLCGQQAAPRCQSVTPCIHMLATSLPLSLAHLCHACLCLALLPFQVYPCSTQSDPSVSQLLKEDRYSSHFLLSSLRLSCAQIRHFPHTMSVSCNNMHPLEVLLRG